MVYQTQKKKQETFSNKLRLIIVECENKINEIKGKKEYIKPWF